nr:myb-related transcription factor, partner of profilin [Aegilops tauschii subsp. strangulata]
MACGIANPPPTPLAPLSLWPLSLPRQIHLAPHLTRRPPREHAAVRPRPLHRPRPTSSAPLPTCALALPLALSDLSPLPQSPESLAAVAPSPPTRRQTTAAAAIPKLKEDGAFLPWLRSKAGSAISSALRIGSSPLGRSLFASQLIQEGTAPDPPSPRSHTAPDPPRLLPRVASVFLNSGHHNSGLRSTSACCCASPKIPFGIWQHGSSLRTVERFLYC